MLSLTSFCCFVLVLFGFVFRRKQFKLDCQLILVPKSTQDSKDYGEIKLASDTVLGIPSQVRGVSEVVFGKSPRFFPSVVVVAVG